MNSINTSESAEDILASSKTAGKPHARKLLYRRVALLEIVIYLGAALLIDEMFFDGARFADVQPHPFWIPVVLISVKYGTTMGLVSALACTLAFLLGNIPEMLLGQDLYQWLYSAFKLPLLWLVSAIVIGEISIRHINERIYTVNELAESQKRESTLMESFRSINNIKERMEIRAAGQWHTLRKVLLAVQNIEYLDSSMVLEGALDLVESLLEPEQFSIYLYRNNALQKKFSKGWNKDEGYLHTIEADNPIFNSVIGERRILCISNPADEHVLGGQGIIAGPLIIPKTGEVLGMLKIEKMVFGKLSLNTVMHFKFLSKWIGSIYGEALAYQARDNCISSHFNQSVQSDYFFEFLKQYLTDMANRIGFNITVLKIQVKDYSILPNEMRGRFKFVLEQAARDVFRRTDLVFSVDSGEGEYAILLSGRKRQDEESIKNRMQRALDKRLALVTEEIEYVLETELLSNANRFISD